MKNTFEQDKNSVLSLITNSTTNNFNSGIDTDTINLFTEIPVYRIRKVLKHLKENNLIIASRCGSGFVTYESTMKCIQCTDIVTTNTSNRCLACRVYNSKKEQSKKEQVQAKKQVIVKLMGKVNNAMLKKEREQIKPVHSIKELVLIASELVQLDDLNDSTIEYFQDSLDSCGYAGNVINTFELEALKSIITCMLVFSNNPNRLFNFVQGDQVQEYINFLNNNNKGNN